MIILAIIRRAMLRALQWRLLLLSPLVLLVAAVATLLPLAGFLGEVFDHSTRWNEITASLDSPALAGLAKAFETPAAAGLATGVETSVLLALIFAPFLAGAALFVAAVAPRPKLSALLSGAAGSYARLFRMQLAAIVPLVAAAIVASVAFGWAFHVADQATSKAATVTSGRIAWLVSMIAVFLAQLAVDAGRARLAAEPARRSALVALGAGVKLIVKRPAQTLSIGLSSTVVSMVAAAALLVVRQQITQSSGAAIALAFVLAQLAVAAIAWSHAAKLCGLVEIVRELAASRGAGPKSTTGGPVQSTETPLADEPATYD